MKTIPHSNPAAEEQAALWAARLDGSKLSPADQIALDAWLAADASHRALLSHYCQFSADLEEQLPVLVASGAVSMPVEKKASAPRFAWFAGLATAAAAALAVAFWVGRGEARQGTFVTAQAERQEQVLPDGTRLQLNARTSVRVELTATERRVHLAGGEAFFAVAKDASRPFFVVTPAGAVRVTGTQFNVRTETAGDLEVTVSEGSVQVRPANAEREVAPYALKAGDRLTANAKGVDVQALTVSALENTLAWREGRMVFEQGVRLAEAAERFARYHGIGIRIEGTARELLVGGTFALDDLQGFLNSQAAMYPVTVSQEPSGNWVIAPKR